MKKEKFLVYTRFKKTQ